jgi:hypothetical protein
MRAQAFSAIQSKPPLTLVNRVSQVAACLVEWPTPPISPKIIKEGCLDHSKIMRVEVAFLVEIKQIIQVVASLEQGNKPATKEVSSEVEEAKQTQEEACLVEILSKTLVEVFSGASSRLNRTQVEDFSEASSKLNKIQEEVFSVANKLNNPPVVYLEAILNKTPVASLAASKLNKTLKVVYLVEINPESNMASLKASDSPKYINKMQVYNTT